HLVHPDQWEGESLHPHAEARRDRGRQDLPTQLLPPGQPAEVVDRSDRGRDPCADQHTSQLTAERQEGERGDEDPEEEREAAETRDLVAGPFALDGTVDKPEVPRRTTDRRREDEHDRERGERAPKHFEVVGELAPDHYFVP